MKRGAGFRVSIQLKVIGFLLVVAAISVASVAAVSIRQATVKLKENAFLHFEEMALEQALLVQRGLARGVEDCRLLAASLRGRVPGGDMEAIRRELVERKAMLEAYEDITLIDPTGHVLTSTDYNYRGEWRYRDVFRRALEGESAVSTPYMINDPLKAVITFAAPVKGEGDEAEAVLAAQYNLENIWRVTDSLRLEKSGYVLVLDESGRYLAHPDKEMVMRLAVPGLWEHLRESGEPLEYRDERGRVRLGDFVILAETVGFRDSPEAGEAYGLPAWRVGVTQEASEVMRLVGDFRRQAILFSLVAFLVVALAGAWLAGTMVRPIRKLTLGAEAIRAGDLDHRVEVKSRDEIGKLAAAFNEMAAAVSLDIAERQRSAEALAQSEALYRLLVNISPDAIFLADLDANVMMANQQGVALFGFRSQEEMIGENFFDYVVEEDLERARRDYRRRPPDGAVVRNVEYRMFRRDGSDFPAELSASLLRDTEGRPRGFIAVVRDITRRKEAEEALRASEERYRAVFESTGTAMCMLNEDGTIAMANQELAALSGRPLEQLEGKTRLTSLLSGEDRHSFEKHMEDSLRGPAQVAVRFPLSMKGAGSETTHLLGNMVRVPGTRTLVVSLMDVTREREYERALEDRARQLRDFLSIASHELRHPITLVKGYVELLTEELGEICSERQRTNLKRAQAAAERLNLLGEELTDASRIEQGRFILKRHRLRLEEVIEEAIEEMRGRDVDNPLIFRRLNDCKHIEADREKVHRLLVILMENAVKFSPPGEPVEVELEERDFEQVVSVLDRGMGVPDEERLRIFDRFYQVEDVQHHSTGLGLGLYIATEIVEAHGGRIWCDAREGGGSAFRFSLPLLPS